MLYWITLVGGLFAGFLVASFFFRRHYRNYQAQILEREREIEHRKEALQLIMYQTHHEGINPVCKRIRGFTNLGLMTIARSTRDLDDLRQYFQFIESEALELETKTLSKVKEFEHLS